MSETTVGTTTPRTAGRKRVSAAERAKKRKTQITWGVALLVTIVAIGFFLRTQSELGGVHWIFGVALGVILQRSRFCFTAALRDPVLTGGTNLLKAVIIALAVATVGYVAIQFGRFGIELNITGSIPGHVKPAGLHTVIGAFIFGIGAVIAGGCASGTVMRVGEGYQMQWLSIIFFIIGSVLGVVIFPIWRPLLNMGASVYLPQALGGWLPAIVLQTVLLLSLYILADWWGHKKAEENA
ncbi:MAG: YeeE/YedE thiosulfate transporter family protein [Alkalispirochaeta sp.]